MHALVGRLLLLRPLSLALLLQALAASASAQPGAFDLLDLSGGELFSQFCSSCHGEAGRGDGPVASSLAARVPDLTRISERYGGLFPAEEVRQTIDGRSVIDAHGTRYMPVWGYEFWWEEGADQPAEAEARELVVRIVEHLRTLQR